MTETDIAGIPVGNVRVHRDQFVTLWRLASERVRDRRGDGVEDWHAAGVALTCRWLACAPVRLERCPGALSRSPATRKPCLAYEELIEDELLAAQRLEELWPDLAARPGWCDAVRATLRWAWRGVGPPPIDLPDESAAQPEAWAVCAAPEASPAP